jgi:plastocyanin
VPWKLFGPLLLLLVSVPAPPPAPPPSPAPSPAVGDIEGVIHMKPPRPRRSASRYPAGGAAVAREIQRIPAVVYLEGRIGEAPAAPTGVVMAQQDTSFAPPLLVIPVGTTVRFPNQDPFFHNVFSYSSAARFDLGRFPRGESKDVTFEEPGLVKVYCEVHESMRAAIIVVENGFWARPDKDGRFRIAGVPAGTYTLVAWHVDNGEKKVQVNVPSDGVVRVELDL